ncbi:MAG: VCBS repeat-containing protein, partial [Flavobacteriales bacterium]|nr:VCBS repeat-containing protein [Flavobacteriales bacterium]
MRRSMLVFLGLATSVLHAQLWEEVVLAEGNQGLIRQVVVGDFDLDGDLDLVRVTPEGLYLHVAAPAGDLGDAMTLKAVEHWRVVVGDLDLDGDLDLVTLEGDRSIHWHAGDGMGGFVEMAEILAASTQNVLFGLGDLDQDGDLDLVISTAAEGLAWLAGDGSGAFSAAVGLVPPPFYPSGMSIVDVDLDGLLDLVWHRELAGAKVQQAMFGLGGGAFSPELTLTSDGYTQNRFRVADLTGDSLPDLLTFGNQNQEVVLLSR